VTKKSTKDSKKNDEIRLEESKGEEERKNLDLKIDIKQQ
jgi:hypothetical protein